MLQVESGVLAGDTRDRGGSLVSLVISRSLVASNLFIQGLPSYYFTQRHITARMLPKCDYFNISNAAS